MNIPTLNLDHAPIDVVSSEDVRKAGRHVVRSIGESDRPGIAQVLDMLKINADTLAHGLHPFDVQMELVRESAGIEHEPDSLNCCPQCYGGELA